LYGKVGAGDRVTVCMEAKHAIICTPGHLRNPQTLLHI